MMDANRIFLFRGSLSNSRSTNAPSAMETRGVDKKMANATADEMMTVAMKYVIICVAYEGNKKK